MVVTLLVLYLLGDILLPFIVGMALAYLLDPFVDRFERMGLNRAISTAIVAVLSFVVLGSAVVFFVPLLGIQIRELFGILPATLETLVSILQVHFPELISTDSQLGLSLNKFLGFFQSYSNEILTGIYSSFNLAWQAGTFLIIVPVVFIYSLADWDNMIARIDSLLPMDHKETNSGIGWGSGFYPVQLCSWTTHYLSDSGIVLWNIPLSCRFEGRFDNRVYCRVDFIYTFPGCHSRRSSCNRVGVVPILGKPTLYRCGRFDICFGANSGR